MPFKPGKSGNPGGRPKVLKDVQEAARQYCGEAIKTLYTIMKNPEEPGHARITAASVLLDRGYGKALQTVESNNTNVNYVMSDAPMTDEEWAVDRVTEH